MNVSMIDCTGMGHRNKEHAIDILLFTKNTRLEMSPNSLDAFSKTATEKKLEELEYMARTIPSSWEFIDYTFMIEGVTRAFTHQLVRTRTASYAQQTMRVLNVRGWDYLTGPTIAGDADRNAEYRNTMTEIAIAYDSLIEQGASIEDARGILPTNILTNIVMKCDMRTFTDMVRKRSSPRTQSEYRDVLDAMKDAVLKEHPWMQLFISRDFDAAAHELDEAISEFDIPKERRMQLMKLVDEMRRFG